MSRKSNNSESKIKVFCGAVDYSENYNINDLIFELYNIYGGSYYYICHDKDINENGEIKHKHFHFVLHFKNGVRISTLRKFIDDFTKLNNNHVEKCNSECASIKYLIHKNDSLKYQYNKDDIITNKLSSLDYFLDIAEDVVCDYDIIQVIATCNSMYEISIKLGSKIFVSKYKFIETIFNELYSTSKLDSDIIKNIGEF